MISRLVNEVASIPAPHTVSLIFLVWVIHCTATSQTCLHTITWGLVKKKKCILNLVPRLSEFIMDSSEQPNLKHYIRLSYRLSNLILTNFLKAEFLLLSLQGKNEVEGCGVIGLKLYTYQNDGVCILSR